MRKWLNTYLALSKREFNGLMILICCILIISVVPVLYRWLFPAQLDQAAAEKALQALALAKDPVAGNSRAPGALPFAKRTDPKQVGRLFPFNPNTLGQKGWQLLGFSERQVGSIMKYIEKGGRFTQATDLKRLYVVSAEAYNRLAPYVRIPAASDRGSGQGQQEEPSRYKAPRQERTAVVVDLNRADSVTLLQIRGVGPAFARRIVRYRERIGGFHRKEQLMEVFGLDSVKFQEIQEQVFVDPAAIKTLNINTAGFEDFKNHPYLSYKQANAIIQYRVQHGNYGNFEDLKKVAILSPDLLDKLAPYISF